MSEPASQSSFEADYARYAALGEGTKAELVAGGEIRLLPRPRVRHVVTASALANSLGGSFGFNSDGPGGWLILHEPELRLGDQVRAPDLCGWRVERFEDPGDAAYITQAPDWICEVLSPSTARYDRKEKMPLFAEHRVEHLWLIDPGLRTLEVYRREGGLWLALGTHADADLVRAEPFDAVELDLGALWRMPGDVKKP